MKQLLTDAREYRDAIKDAYMYQYHRNEPHWKEVHDIAHRLEQQYGKVAFLRLEAIAVSFT